MGRTFASLNCRMRCIESGGLFRCSGFALKRCIRERARHRIGHDFKQLGNGGKLAVIELIEKLMDVIPVDGHYCYALLSS